MRLALLWPNSVEAIFAFTEELRSEALRLNHPLDDLSGPASQKVDTELCIEHCAFAENCPTISQSICSVVADVIVDVDVISRKKIFALGVQMGSGLPCGDWDPSQRNCLADAMPQVCIEANRAFVALFDRKPSMQVE